MSTPARLDIIGDICEALESLSRTDSAMLGGFKALVAQQDRLWADNAALRDELHTLSLALVSAGIPLVDPPPLRSVS